MSFLSSTKYIASALSSISRNLSRINININTGKPTVLTIHNKAEFSSLSRNNECSKDIALKNYVINNLSKTRNPSSTLINQVRNFDVSSLPVMGEVYETPDRILAKTHKSGRYKRVKKKRLHPLEGKPQLKGVVLKTLVKKPKKPNSANRKCVKVRLSTGREVIAYVPGEGHNLQEHNIVLVQGGRLQDVPGVKVNCVRGKYDLPHVKKK